MAIEHPIRVIGIQDAHTLAITDCDVVFGGQRHLGQVTTDATKKAWVHPFADNRQVMNHDLEHGRKVAVIASGDPLCFGVGETLIDWFGEKMVQVEPVPSAFALACAALAWRQQDCKLVTAHGRALSDLQPALHHGARLIVLGDKDTATGLAQMLKDMGLGHSKVKALSHLGGPEQVIANHPLNSAAGYPSLTTYAVDCRSDGSVENWALGPGLPDYLFDHDGTMTKRDVRAITVAKIAPRDHQVFWDIGAGNGSVAIEIARLAPKARVYGLDNREERLAKARENAVRLAGPNRIQWDWGTAPFEIPEYWPQPDCVFLGGGVGNAGLLQALWDRLATGGRLVANAVTLEGEAELLAFRKQAGGELTRISVAREEAVGPLNGWKPSMPILQYEGHKLRSTD